MFLCTEMTRDLIANDEGRGLRWERKREGSLSEDCCKEKQCSEDRAGLDGSRTRLDIEQALSGSEAASLHVSEHLASTVSA